MHVAGEGSRRAGPVGGKRTCQVTHAHGPRALEVTFSSQKTVVPPTITKNWRTHMTLCQQERATVEEMTCQPTDLRNDFWLCPEGDRCFTSLSVYGMKRPKTCPAIFTLTRSTEVERGNKIKTDQSFPSCFWLDDPDIVSNHTRGMTRCAVKAISSRWMVTYSFNKTSQWWTMWSIFASLSSSQQQGIFWIKCCLLL